MGNANWDLEFDGKSPEHPPAGFCTMFASQIQSGRNDCGTVFLAFGGGIRSGGAQRRGSRRSRNYTMHSRSGRPRLSHTRGLAFLHSCRKCRSNRTERGRSFFDTRMWSRLNEDMGTTLILASARTLLMAAMYP